MCDIRDETPIIEATFYYWKAKYGGLDLSQTRRRRQLEEEDGRLKKIVAQQTLNLDALKAVLEKKWWARRRSEKRCVSCGKKAGLSERRACRLDRRGMAAMTAHSFTCVGNEPASVGGAGGQDGNPGLERGSRGGGQTRCFQLGRGLISKRQPMKT